MPSEDPSKDSSESARKKKAGDSERPAWGVIGKKSKKRNSDSPPEPDTRVRSARLGHLVAKSLEAESKKSTYALIDERSVLLRSALRRLPDAIDRKIMVMRFFLGQNLTQIAEELELDQEDVKERYRVGLRIMDKELRGRI